MYGLGAGFGKGFLRGIYLTRGLEIITSIWFYDYGYVMGVQSFTHIRIYIRLGCGKREESICKPLNCFLIPISLMTTFRARVECRRSLRSHDIVENLYVSRESVSGLFHMHANESVVWLDGVSFCSSKHWGRLTGP